MKKIKKILAFLKNVVWPVAKPFICADKAEAEELYTWMSAKGTAYGSIGEGGAEFPELEPMPQFFHRLKNAIENE